MEETELNGEDEVHFEQDQVIWAKITGHPWWPGIIAAMPCEENAAFRVDFFADNTHAYLAPSKIAKYQLLRCNIDAHKHMKKGLRKAIQSADRAYDRQRGPPLAAESAENAVEALLLAQKQLSESSLIKQVQLSEKKQKEQGLLIIDEGEQLVAEQMLEQQQINAVEESYFALGHSYEHKMKYVNQLLRKYELDSLPVGRYSREEERARSKKSKLLRKVEVGRRTKKMSKLHQLDGSLFYMLARRVNRSLKLKEGLSQGQRQEASLSLCRQMESSQQMGSQNRVEEMRKLLKWIDISSGGTIASYYQSWSSLQAEKEKASNMTTEQ